jgi:hypothetical protein
MNTEFQTEYQGDFAKPTEEEARRTHTVERYFLRCDMYDKTVEGSTFRHPGESRVMMQQNARRVIKELADREGITVSELKGWIQKYNKGARRPRSIKGD